MEKRLNMPSKKDLTSLVVGTVLLGATALGVVNYQDRKTNALLEDYNAVEYTRIGEGDNYWLFAEKLKESNPELKGLDTRAIVNKLQKINSGKQLYAGEKLAVPVYEINK
ncbi:MAG: hypothetical protein KKA64_02250 [Nanoarchaeota archaeon]|nr:hypothetical protein [Nanoarchaeota archaeon]